MTIEAILNLIWLGVVVATVCLWRFRWSVSRRGEGRGCGRHAEAIAIVCVLALLFPVISLTDDLHPEVLPVDSVSSKRNLCLLVAHGAQGHARAHSNPPSVFHGSIGPSLPADVLLSRFVPRVESPLQLFRLGVRSERAPPFLA